ncbi:phosphatidate cytidylyltransferase [Micromonospora zamorensis]|uniref:phosphatidate cytidylyltransferase n=1 Tax=Micromonospora zamorensis TaxID=709883 RepID=UPI00081FBD38|nr:phosphatidate cytidylyltransferase [Micromonospora zamorensis]SCG38337.1 phosphatidate cytidylyltransferase [Micromonospora zamorensis]
MSHPDPYGSEPRGWDRAERPVALPWPEQDLEAGQWSRRPTAGPELYADPHTRPYADPNPYDERGRTVRPDDRDRFDDRDPREDDRNQPDRYDGPQPFDGPVRYDDDAGYPTAQLAPIGAEIAPDPGPVIEPEPPSGRRTKGRRRASVDRPATQQLGTGRAGRNLPAAIGVGLGLGALIVVPLVVYPLAFLLVLAGAVAVGMWEMARAVRRSGAHPPLVPLIAGGVLTVGLAWFAGPDALSLGLLVTVLGTMIWRLGDGPAGFQRDLTAATLIAVYVPFLAGFAALLAAAPDDGPLRILATLIAVVLSDTGGYAAGVSFGRHPMAPSISPKKSWEGFAGSVTAAALGSALLLWLMFEVAPWWGAVFGVAVSCAAVLGDLAESMIKRDLGVKDMSNLLPGHGGLMDRLDSILFAVPTAYLLLAVFVPVVN